MRQPFARASQVYPIAKCIVFATMTTPLLSARNVELQLPAASHASNVGFRPSVRASTDQKSRLSVQGMEQADQGT